MRLLPAAREILRILAVCPWIPIDVLTAINGARSRVSVYQTLGRLSAAGLVQNRHLRPAVFGGTRPIAVWATTTAGIDARTKRKTRSGLSFTTFCVATIVVPYGGKPSGAKCSAEKMPCAR